MSADWTDCCLFSPFPWSSWKFWTVVAPSLLENTWTLAFDCPGIAGVPPHNSQSISFDPTSSEGLDSASHPSSPLLSASAASRISVDQRQRRLLDLLWTSATPWISSGPGTATCTFQRRPLLLQNMGLPNLEQEAYIYYRTFQ